MLSAQVMILVLILSVLHTKPDTINSHYLDLAYLEVKIWSLFKHVTLTTGNKILWKRGEIAPGCSIYFSLILQT